jgi:iron(III) transport system substrate-binding protein
MINSKFILAGCMTLMSAGLASTAQSADPMTVYCPMSEDDCRSVLQAFETDTGLKSSFVRMGAGEVLARVRAEKSNPQAALWLAGAADIFIQGASEGLLEAYQPANIERVSQDYRSADNFWTPIAISPIAFVYNLKYLKELGVEPPTSWKDFANPVFKDAIALTHPASSGTAYVSLASMIQIYGEDPAFDILKSVDENVLQYSRSAGGPGQMVASGEVAISMAFTHGLEVALAKDFPIGVSFPTEGTGYELNVAALVANAPEAQRPTAKAFLDWIVTDNGQRALGATYREAVVDGFENTNFKIDLKSVKLINYDSRWAGENRSRLLARYEKDVREAAAAK